jgi:hypothetical protein
MGLHLSHADWLLTALFLFWIDFGLMLKWFRVVFSLTAFFLTYEIDRQISCSWCPSFFLTCVISMCSLRCRLNCCVNRDSFCFFLSIFLSSLLHITIPSSLRLVARLCHVPEISRTCGFILDKSDTAFTRSRSSSTSSLENHPNEAVTTLTFADTLARKLGLFSNSIRLFVPILNY